LWQFEERVELLRGKIRQMAVPSRKHQDLVGNLHVLFKNKLWRSPCKVYVVPFDVRLTRFDKSKNQEVLTVVQPDLCVICDPAKLDDRGCVGAPDLIIEILSPATARRK
jgi:Uma2 family endonuclease